MGATSQVHAASSQEPGCPGVRPRVTCQVHCPCSTLLNLHCSASARHLCVWREGRAVRSVAHRERPFCHALREVLGHMAHLRPSMNTAAMCHLLSEKNG